MNPFSVAEQILRNRNDFFAEIRERKQLGQKLSAMLVSSFVSLALYGLVMGMNHSVWQALSSALKLPALFLLTLLICTPSLHILNVLFGSNKSVGQTLAMILTAITTSAILLVSLMPVTFFFFLSTSDYLFFKLLNVVFFIFSGTLGITFLLRGMYLFETWDNAEGKNTRRLILYGWIVLYAFVGSQMAWTLRPFMGIPGREYILFSQRGGNIYTDVIESLLEFLQIA